MYIVKLSAQKHKQVKQQHKPNCSAFLDTRFEVTSYIYDAPKHTQQGDLDQS